MLILVALLSLLSSPVWATTYYVSKTASNGYAVGNNANSCAQAQSKSTPKNTISGSGSAALEACMVGGDELIVNEGTYTNQITNPPAGTPSAYTIIRAEPSSARPIIQPNGAAVQRGFYCDTGDACSYIHLEGFDVVDAYNSVKLALKTVGSVSTYPHHLKFINNKFHDTRSTNFETNTDDAGLQGGNHLIKDNEFYHTGIYYPVDHGGATYGPGHNTIYNPGSGTIIEGNKFHNLHNAVGIWHSQKTLFDVIVRRNTCYNIGLVTTDTWLAAPSTATGYSCVHVSSGGGRHKIHNNTVYHSGEHTNFKGFSVNPIFGGATLQQIDIDNNTIYEMRHSGAIGIRVSANDAVPNSVRVRNNLIIPVLGTAIADQSGLGAMVQTTNRTSGTASAIFTSPGTGDLTLISGSVAINAGTAIGYASCGVPDQGAFETCGPVSASIDGRTLDLTLDTAYPNWQPTTAGWTFGCTGTGCGTPVINSVSIPVGTSAIIRFDISGITGNACAAGQTWTISYSSATGATTDSALIGNAANQELLTFTSFSVTNNCSVGGGGGGEDDTGPTYPGTPFILYKFNGDSTDFIGANDGTDNGVTYLAAKYSQGMHTDDGQDDYTEAPYPSGVNPTATSLTFVIHFFVDAADLGVTRDIGGTSLGTNQKFFIWRNSSNNLRLGIQANSGNATEFTIKAGWNEVAVTFNSATNTATLWHDGVAGTIDGASVHTYTSYTFASNFRVGLPSGFATTLSGNHLYEDFLIYQSVADVAAIYAAFEPNVSPWTGTLTTVAARPYHVKVDSGLARIPLAANNVCATIPNYGAFAGVFQIDGTAADPSPVGFKAYYSCALCPSGGTLLAVPNSANADGLRFYSASEAGLLTGSPASPLVGALTLAGGATHMNSSSVQVVDMAQNNSTLQSYGFQLDGAQAGWEYRIRLQEQSGVALDNHTTAGELCIITSAPATQSGF